MRYSDQIVRSKLKSCDNTSSSKATREFALREHRNPTSDDTLDIGEGGIAFGNLADYMRRIADCDRIGGNVSCNHRTRAIMEFEPIVTPGVTVTFAPNHTLSPIVTGEACSQPASRVAASSMIRRGNGTTRADQAILAKRYISAAAHHEILVQERAAANGQADAIIHIERRRELYAFPRVGERARGTGGRPRRDHRRRCG